jgi:phosphoesterase RecJ-like protein
MLTGRFEDIIKLLAQAERILLLPHLHADGDALGSCGALAAFLQASGKQVTVLTEEPVEPKLDFLPGLCGVDFLPLSGLDELFGPLAEPAKFCELAAPYDLAVAIDSSAPDRLGTRLPLYEAATARARIDHHAAGTDFSPVTLLDNEWSATAEGIYLLLHRMGFDRGVDRPEWLTAEVEKAVAGAIYTGLVTDTGCFAFSNVTAQTHLIASRARMLAGNMSFVSHRVYEVKSRAYTRLMRTVYEKMYYPQPDIAVLCLTRAEMDAAGATDVDTDGISNILRDIEGVHAGIFVKPDRTESGVYRVSLRSDEYVNVALIAKAFGGGGHVCAAGCSLFAADDAALASEVARLVDAVRAGIVQ